MTYETDRREGPHSRWNTGRQADLARRGYRVRGRAEPGRSRADRHHLRLDGDRWVPSMDVVLRKIV